MGALELNKVAIIMGKVIKLLSEMEPKIHNANDVYDEKEGFMIIAYLCRIGILDRIENNSWIRPETSIRIPTGIFSSRKESISSGLMLTVDKLKKMVSKDFITEEIVEDVLNHRGYFYQVEKMIPDNIKKSI